MHAQKDAGLLMRIVFYTGMKESSTIYATACVEMILNDAWKIRIRRYVFHTVKACIPTGQFILDLNEESPYERF